MIRGSFAGPSGRRRPQVVAHVTVEPNGMAEEVTFLIDTGADRSLLSTADAEALGLDPAALPAGRSVGIGGGAATALASVVIALGARRFRATLRVLTGSMDGHRQI